MATSSLLHEADDSAIRCTLHSLRKNFFDSLSDHVSSLKTFHDAWTAFSGTVEKIGHQLEFETLEMVYDFSTTVDIMASNMLQLESTSEVICHQFASDITNILDDGMKHLTIDDAQVLHEGINTVSFPQYILPSYTWLLVNLHNPYPSKDVREAISLKSSCSRKEVDNWFADARKRMGWNALRRACFSNRRTDIINAATRFFANHDPKHPLTDNVQLAFSTIATNAKGLYSENIQRSPLAIDLDTMLSASKPSCVKERTKKEPNQRKQVPRKLSQVYPSPEASPEPSPVPSSAPHNGNAIRKRRIGEEHEDSSSTVKSYKRSRYDVSLVPFDSSLCFPSPVSDNGSCEPDKENALSLSPSILSIPTLSTPNLKRKRRLSNSDCHGFPKRLRELPAGPRLQSASDPTSWLSKASEEVTFDFLQPCTIEDLDFSVPLDVEVCDWTDVFASSRPALSESPASSSILTSTSTPETPYSLSLPGASQPGVDFDFIDPTNMFLQAERSPFHSSHMEFFDDPISHESRCRMDNGIGSEPNDELDSLSLRAFDTYQEYCSLPNPNLSFDFSWDPFIVDPVQLPSSTAGPLDLPFDILETCIDAQPEQSSNAEIEAELQKLESRRQQLEEKLRQSL